VARREKEATVPDTTIKPLRADAQRNRTRLLEAAVHAFSQDGPEVTLDCIAKDAGVGIGTLYRHFPTRESLVDAAYRPRPGADPRGRDACLDGPLRRLHDH
jgi:AcrR family transcriptional regulator